MKKIKKYRPSLSYLQIQTIVNLAKSSELDREAISIITTLAPFLSKIENETISASYTSSFKGAKDANISLESLGESSISSEDDLHIHSISKEAYWEQCYTKYSTNPNSCTLSEIKCSQEWRYLNDLMTQEEEVQHERGAS